MAAYIKLPLRKSNFPKTVSDGQKDRQNIIKKYVSLLLLFYLYFRFLNLANVFLLITSTILIFSSIVLIKFYHISKVMCFRRKLQAACLTQILINQIVSLRHKHIERFCKLFVSLKAEYNLCITLCYDIFHVSKSSFEILNKI